MARRVRSCGVLPMNVYNFIEESQRSQSRRHSQQLESEESRCPVGELEEHSEGLKSPGTGQGQGEVGEC